MKRSSQAMELLVERADDGTMTLRSPEVGAFTGALPKGRALSAGTVCGTLHTLGRAIDLLVPAGVHGTITSVAPPSIMAAVGFGHALYAVDPSGVAAGADAGAAAAEHDGPEDGALVVCSKQPGRVWHSPSPGDPPLCSVGDVLEAGSPVCLIEVMKTFSNVQYTVENGLPARGKVVRWLVNDGADVEQGEPLVQIEPA